jgi:hypothetical protein
MTLSSRSVLVGSVVFLSLLGRSQAASPTNAWTSDFAFLQPWFQVQRNQREQLERRGVVVRGLPPSDRQLGVIAACGVVISPDAFVARILAAGEDKRSESSAGRFDDPPTLENLAGLSLDEADLERLRLCRPSDCRLNLADHEMSTVQLALRTSPRGASPEGQRAFRGVVLDRLRRYLSGGLAALPEYHDRPEPVRPAVIFSDIIQQTPYLTAHVPAVAAYLERFPFSETDGAESSLLWSKVMMNGKAVVMVNHLSVFRPKSGPNVPTVLVAGKQVYASRYMNGQLALTMLFAGAAGSPSYLVHVNRSELDELAGTFSGLKRAVIEGRIKQEASAALAALRDKLERAE